MSLNPAHMIDPLADVFVVPDRLRPKLRDNLRGLPRIRVVRTAIPGATQANAYRNAEAHAVPGGGIIFMHGPLPFHAQEALLANYVNTGPHRIS